MGEGGLQIWRLADKVGRGGRKLVKMWMAPIVISQINLSCKLTKECNSGVGCRTNNKGLYHQYIIYCL